MKNPFAVITGAARGLGKAFSFELSKRGYNTILIDLPKRELDQTCSEIEEKYNTTSVFYETDLSKIDKIITLTNQLKDNYNFCILINNVGVGGTKRFADADVEYLNTIIQLNVMATTIMTKQLLPVLKKQEKAYVLNVSSVAAFSPVAFKTIYPASKVFVHYFTRGLCEEYKNSNLFFSVVHPGPMRTNNDVTTIINNHTAIGRLGIASPEKVAEISIRRLLKRRRFIIFNGNRLSWFLLNILPTRIRIPLFSMAIKKELIKHNG